MSKRTGWVKLNFVAELPEDEFAADTHFEAMLDEIADTLNRYKITGATNFGVEDADTI